MKIQQFQENYIQNIILKRYLETSYENLEVKTKITDEYQLKRDDKLVKKSA